MDGRFNIYISLRDQSRGAEQPANRQGDLCIPRAVAFSKIIIKHNVYFYNSFPIHKDKTNTFWDFHHLTTWLCNGQKAEHKILIKLNDPFVGCIVLGTRDVPSGNFTWWWEKFPNVNQASLIPDPNYINHAFVLMTYEWPGYTTNPAVAWSLTVNWMSQTLKTIKWSGLQPRLL